MASTLQEPEQYRRSWIFQGRPERFKYKKGEASPWELNRYIDQVLPGDFVFLWQSGKQAGIYAWGEIVSIEPSSENPEQTLAFIENVIELDKPLLKTDIENDIVNFGGLLVLRNPTGANFRLTYAETVEICHLIGDNNTPLGLYPENFGLTGGLLGIRSLEDFKTHNALKKTFYQVGQSSFFISEVIRKALKIEEPETKFVGFVEWISEKFPFLYAPESEGISPAFSFLLSLSRIIAIGTRRRETILPRDFVSACILIQFNTYRFSSFMDEIKANEDVPFVKGTKASAFLEMVRDSYNKDELKSFDQVVTIIMGNWKTSSRVDDKTTSGYTIAEDTKVNVSADTKESKFSKGARSTDQMTSTSGNMNNEADVLDEAFDDQVDQLFALIQNDNADGEDKLGILSHVHGLSAIVASEKVTPPLSLAIFGDWGSGKSFFMNKMKEVLSSQPGDKSMSDNVDLGGHAYKNIAQIDFNAWHFVESDMWASIAYTIFNDLQTYLVRKDEDFDARENLRKRMALTTTYEAEFEKAFSEAEEKQKLAERKLKAKRTLIKALNRQLEASKSPNLWGKLSQKSREDLQNMNEFLKSFSETGIDISLESEVVQDATGLISEVDAARSLLESGIVEFKALWQAFIFVLKHYWWLTDFTRAGSSIFRFQTP